MAVEQAPSWQTQQTSTPQGARRCVLRSTRDRWEFALLYGTDMNGVMVMLNEPDWYIPPGYMVRMNAKLDGVRFWGMEAVRTPNGQAALVTVPSEQVRYMLGRLSLAQAMQIELPPANAVPITQPQAGGGIVLQNALAPGMRDFPLNGAATALDSWVECVKRLPGVDLVRAGLESSASAQRASLPADGSFAPWRSYVDQDAGGGRSYCAAVTEARDRMVRIVALQDRTVTLHLLQPNWDLPFRDDTQFEVFFAFGNESAHVYRAQKTGAYVSVFLAGGDTSAGQAPLIGIDDFLARLGEGGRFSIGFSSVLQLPAWQVAAPNTVEAVTGLRRCLDEINRH